MARLIIANNPEGMRIKRRWVDSVQDGIVEILKSKGAYRVSGGESSSSGTRGWSGEFSETYEMPGMGSADLRACYIAEGKSWDYSSSTVKLVGVQDLWRVGAEVPLQIKRYFAELEMPIYRDEITTEHGTAFVKGAGFSEHMKEHGNRLVLENSQGQQI